MEERLSEDDIYNVLDTFGSSSRLEAAILPGGDVGFTDPLLVQFEAQHTKKKGKAKETKETETLENIDSLWFVNSPAAFLQNDWQELFDTEEYLQTVKETALHGKLRHTAFRGLCWKLFWDVLPEERENWIAVSRSRRKDYDCIRDRHIKDPYEISPQVDLHVNNPLSQEAESPWHQYFQDNELNQTIVQDLDRLYPELDFFHQAEIQNMLLRCLFCYGKEHPEVDYKQGMHEILAPVVYVLWENAQSVKESKEDLQEAICIINDEKFVEHDSYCLFSQIMETMEPLFLNNRPQYNIESPPSDSQKTNADNLFLEAPPGQQVSAISKKLTRIQNYMLKRYDHQLYCRLQELDIAPQLYGIRWVRLLFGREFPLNNLLYLWDAMFADGMSLDLVDYIFIAMLISIREYLLKNDYTSCLSYLMKYPQSIEAKAILKKALALKKTKPKVNHGKKNGKNQTKVQFSRNASLRRQLSESLTQDQQFAQVLGLSKSMKSKQVAKQENPQTTTWYTESEKTLNEKQTHFIDGERHLFDPSSAQVTGTRKQDKVPRGPMNKSKVVSQISNVIGKHTAGLSNEVLSKLSARSKHRPKDNVAQLEEDHERLQKQICQLQSELDRLQSLCLFSAGKMDSYIGFIDMDVDSAPPDSSVVSSCINGLKKVRDILKSSIELEPNKDSYERQFSQIDRRLSAAFDLKPEAVTGKLAQESWQSSTQDIEESVETDPPARNSELTAPNPETSSLRSFEESLDYRNYEKSNRLDGAESLSNGDSERSVSNGQSRSTTPPSVVKEPWVLQPVDSPGDFEKELLAIKSKYSDGSKTNLSHNAGTVLEDVQMLGDFSNSSTLCHDNSSEFLDPLSALEKHFT